MHWIFGPRMLLGLSLAALIGMLGLLWHEKFLSKASPAQSPQSAPRARQVWITNVVTITNLAQFHWSQLESEDYPAYIRNLRAAGCPEQTLRDIIIADLDLLWAPRLRSVYPRVGLRHYWESAEAERRNNFDARKIQRQEREVDREKRAVLKDLIGIDLVSERAKLTGQQDVLDQHLQFLDLDRRMDVRDILERYGEEEWAVREKQWEEGALLSTEDRARLQQIREQREVELDQLLTSEERSQFDLWMSPTANALRHDMYGMNASEQEFLAIYNLRKRFDEAYPFDQLDVEDPQAVARWQGAQDELEQQIQQALGDERYALYQRGQDEDYHLLNRTASRYGLSREDINLVYQLKTVLESERQRVSLDPALSLEERETAFTAMADEAAIAVEAVLGNSAYNYYRRKTSWLNR